MCMLDLSKIKGIVFKFGDDINTDAIIPSKYLDNPDPSYLSQFVMTGIEPNFHERVKVMKKSVQAKYDEKELSIIIVAGKNFGSGSSREQAADALKFSGVVAIVAESIYNIFFRNAINVGLPIVTIPNISNKIDHSSIIEINLYNGTINHIQSEKKLIQFEPIESFLLKRLEHGGLIPELRETVISSKIIK